ncbi:MAG: 2,3-bisphosphoglycerate-independent phosphoglycerate mutase [Acidobacteriota bacterium]
MTDDSPHSDLGPSRGRRKGLQVVSSDGSCRRFLRGMVTHDLVQRGLGFESAYAIAHAIRDRLSNREEVTTSEIKDLLIEELERLYGTELPTSMREPVRRVASIRVAHQGDLNPFSQGLLARSIHAAGVDMDRAYRLVTELESSLRSEGKTRLTSSEIALRVGDLLEKMESVGTAGRYRTMRRIHRLQRPLVIYIGGASGTGKSTLALELAPLLRIYRLNATDTIRQVMRMVFTPSILPALHSSSFEAASAGFASPADETGDSRARIIATFEEQATRVCVGVRAVVERAITENMSILVEGVHLHPGLVPFADLEGSAYQIPLVLGTLNEEAHRSRFIARSRAGRRLGERYLENFSAIRWIHDYLIQQAEHFDWALLDTSEGETPVIDSLRWVTSVLEHKLPAIGRDDWTPTTRSAPTLLLVIDGLADRPIRALGGRTPLQAANTPNLDKLAREGQLGLADPVAPGVVPDTAAGTLALFGQSPLALHRGPVEALGAQISLRPNDIALRGNFATLDKSGQVIDRRAGRIRQGADELARALNQITLPGELARAVEVLVKPATEHRLAIVLRGEGLSSAIQGSDPGETSIPGLPLTPHPDDPNNQAAIFTANALAVFEQKARRVLVEHPVNERRRRSGELPANTILTRGAGRIHQLVSLEEAGLPLRLTCISGDRTILGLANWLGGNCVSNEKMTANLDTNLEMKLDKALEALSTSDLVVVHIKGADIAAHDQRPDLKVEFLERIDQARGRLLERVESPVRIAVASDHATLSESGQHAADPLPILIWGDHIDADEVETYDEQAAATGALHRFPLQMLLGRLFSLS